jgi:hypothetical protein
LRQGFRTTDQPRLVRHYWLKPHHFRSGHSVLLFRFGEQDRFKVACAVQHVDDFDGVGRDAIEDEVVSVNHPSDPADFTVPVTGHKRIGVGCSSQLRATGYKLINKRDGSHGIMISDSVADVIKVEFRFVGEDELHRRRAASLC